MKSGSKMEKHDTNNENDILQEFTADTQSEKARKKPFVQRNKYRIRQICGVLALLVAVSSSVVLLAKCGATIDDADSAITANASAGGSSQADSSQPSSESTSPTTTTTLSDTTPEQIVDSDEGTTTEEQSTTEPQTTTEKLDTTTTAKTTTASQQTTTKPTTTKPHTANLPAKIEVRNGITYVNGILIANKTYTLPADYNPGLDPNAEAAFYKMQQAAAMEGLSLWICSGFRSYSYQQQLYDSYVYQDGKAAADTYSARAGHSEHQSGLAMDINYASSYFNNTPEAKWLAAHCTDYGFIIRYQAGKESSTGYMAEPWHIRYLGDVSLCKDIEASGLSLEEYLGITSVYANP